MEVVTKGPVATAGSIWNFSKIRGTMDPTRAAMDMEDKIARPTAKDSDREKGCAAKVNLAISPIKRPYIIPRIKPTASSFKTTFENSFYSTLWTIYAFEQALAISLIRLIYPVRSVTLMAPLASRRLKV